MAGSYEIEEGLLDIDAAEDCLVRPDGFLAPGGVVAEAHTGCPAVADDDFVHGAAGTDACAVGDGATGDGMSVCVHAAPRHAHSTQHE